MSTYPVPVLKKIQIPVKIIDGEVRSVLDGRRLGLREGATGTLIVSAHAVSDREFLAQFDHRIETEIFSKGTCLMVKLSRRSMTAADRRLLGDTSTIEVDFLVPGYLYAQIILEEPLRLLFRGTKRPELLPCMCTLRELESEKADSVNHAYSLLSQRFETHRRSHTGNVFHKVRYHDGVNWRSLEHRRTRAVNEFDVELTQ